MKKYHFHFPYTVLGWTVALAVCIAIFYLQFFRSTESDRAEYYRLMQEANPTISDKTKKTPYKASQKRSQVQKDLFFSQGNDRLHVKLMSTHANLVLDQQPTGTELVEHMHDVQCFMQEELYYVLPDGREAIWNTNGKLLVRNADPKDQTSWIPLETKGLKPMQAIRYCEANDATYHYKTDRFYAKNVRISRYVAPGHNLKIQLQTLKPVMTGTADAIEFTLAGKEFNFKASKFRAKFNSGKLL